MVGSGEGCGRESLKSGWERGIKCEGEFEDGLGEVFERGKGEEESGRESLKRGWGWKEEGEFRVVEGRGLKWEGETE